MDDITKIQIAGEVDALVDALDAERCRHVAGLEAEPSLVSLFQGSARAAHRETVAELRAAGEPELADRVAALRAERAQAEDEEAWRAAESAAQGAGPFGAIGLVDAELSAVREREVEDRAEYARAAAEACEVASQRREKAVEARARARAEVGLAPDWRAVVEGDAVLGASDEAWHELLGWTARREMGMRPFPHGNLARADLLRLLALRRWSAAFRPGMLALELKAVFEKLGLDLGKVRIDAEIRPAKWGGAHVFGTRVAFRPSGGAPDWIELFDAAGRALAAAHQRPHRRDAAFGHAIGWLLSSLVLEPRYLTERCDVDRRELPDLLRGLRLRRLFVLRARAAALRIATEVERGMSGAAWRDGYRDAMTSALGAVWDGVRAVRDADASAHRAALAGAGLGEALRRSLVERFDEDWWRNPRTAEGLASLLAAGRLPEDPAAVPSLAAATLSGAMGSE
jgi:hypothetical protein